ncbi:hypothetical protein IFM89_013610 [Coptis chinensis]|uniref:Uncharacterized protein n=1 Tax=Coptis chinensis TaxID=261450 RepID=A0A835INI7_9MAGN|nr:hypothetical protein IFM89_013610 [Coptis chinensis]
MEEVGALRHSTNYRANSDKHTIILMQSSHHRATRTFMDYNSISQAMDVSHYTSNYCILPYCIPIKKLVDVPFVLSDLYNLSWQINLYSFALRSQLSRALLAASLVLSWTFCGGSVLCFGS